MNWVDSAEARRATRHHDHRSTKRDRLVLAAARAVAEHGVEASTGQIAELAAVPRPHVYRLFENRDDLLDAVATYAADELVARVRPTLAREGTPLALIAGPVGESVAWADENANLYRFLATRRQREGRRRTGFLDEVFGALRGYLGSRGLAPVISDGVMASLVAMTDASIVWWLDHRDEESDRLVARISRQVWVVLADLAAEQGVAIAADEVFGPPAL